MVQAEVRYSFLHDAILEETQSGKTEVSSGELSKRVEELSKENEETESGYKAEFGVCLILVLAVYSLHAQFYLDLIT